jgi:hypothetical protein
MRTRKWQLFIMPITFHVMTAGWVFMDSSQARRTSSLTDGRRREQGSSEGEKRRGNG